MRRPFERWRPVGPFFALGDEKDVVGVSGTPWPNRAKNDMVLTFALGGDHIVIPKDVTNNIRMKLESRGYQGIEVDFKMSGSSSKANFDEQAVIIRVKGNALPIRKEQLEDIEGVIERNPEYDIRVKGVIIDQE